MLKPKAQMNALTKLKIINLNAGGLKKIITNKSKAEANKNWMLTNLTQQQIGMPKLSKLKTKLHKNTIGIIGPYPSLWKSLKWA